MPDIDPYLPFERWEAEGYLIDCGRWDRGTKSGEWTRHNGDGPSETRQHHGLPDFQVRALL